MDFKTVCVLLMTIAVIVAETNTQDPDTNDNTLSHQRSKRQFFGYPGGSGISSAQASAFSTSSGGGFPGYGGGLSGANAAAFSGTNSFGR